MKNERVGASLIPLWLGAVIAAAGAAIYLSGYRMFFPLFLILAGAAVIGYGILNVLIRRGIAWAFYLRRCVYGLMLVGAVSFCGVQAMIASQQGTDVDFNEEYVIALGAGLDGDVPSWIMRSRMDALADYVEKNPGAVVIACGGMGPLETVTEASVFKEDLIRSGVPEKQILVDEQSRNTAENMKFAAELIRKRSGEGPVRVAVVTNDFHLWRGKYYARKQGLVPTGYCAPTPCWDLTVQYYLREYFSVIKALVGMDIIVNF